jgi:hypothetical protein
VSQEVAEVVVWIETPIDTIKYTIRGIARNDGAPLGGVYVERETDGGVDQAQAEVVQHGPRLLLDFIQGWLSESIIDDDDEHDRRWNQRPVGLWSLIWRAWMDAAGAPTA